MTVIWFGYALIVASVMAIGAKLLDWTVPTSLRHRRWIWMAALVLGAGIPAAGLLVPRAALGRAGRGATSPTAATVVGQGTIVGTSSTLTELIARAEASSLGRMSRPLLGVWVVMALVAIVGYGTATWSLARRRRAWQATQLDGELVLVAPSTGPAVVGALRPRIVVPEWAFDLPAEQRALMLEHERQHVAARDPLLLHTAVAIALLMPWNFVIWWLVRQLRLAVELDCDTRVLATGRDSRAYGTLLLDVCARRIRPGLVFMPALFERTSSLTRRIVAMHSTRTRFGRTRATLGAAAAVALTVLACDMPSPDVVAPDGTNQATKRLYGEVKASPERSAEDNRAMVSRYFPAVARGEGGATILFVVKSHTGDILKTSAQPAPALAPVSADRRQRAPNEAPASERAVTSGARENVLLARTPEVKQRVQTSGEEASVGVRFRSSSRSPRGIPAPIAMLSPDRIEAIEVSKHAAGTIAPNPVSIITITLKTGATLDGATR